MPSITEKIEKINKYVTVLPLTEKEKEIAGIIYTTYQALEKSTETIDKEWRHQLLRYQYRNFTKLAKKVELRLFRHLTPFDAFIYRYILKGKQMLPNYQIYNFSAEEISQRLDKGVSLGTQEMVIDNDLMPSLSSKLPFHSFDGLLKAAKGFLNSVKPQQVESDKLFNFLDRVFESYNFVPYHNFAHAINVMQFFEHMMKRTPILESQYTPEKKFWVFIACICHDMTHYGKNNLYYIKKKHHMAFKSFEKSVLEHYHCEKTLKVMSDDACDIMSYADPTLKASFKRIIIEAILATDMSRHFGLLEEFLALDFTQPLPENDFFKLTGYLVHSSDVANPALDFDNYLLWGELVSQEFHLQTISEKENGLPVMPFFEYMGREAFLKGQCGFINYFVVPLFKQITLKTGNGEFEQQCHENVKTLTEMLSQKIVETK